MAYWLIKQAKYHVTTIRGKNRQAYANAFLNYMLSYPSIRPDYQKYKIDYPTSQKLERDVNSYCVSERTDDY
jgi:hypothetical protein